MGDARQRVPAPSAADRQSPAPAPAQVRQVVGRSGQPLDGSVRAAAEPRFVHDFSRVRVHADEQAGASARALGAAAYTVGPHIAFGRGRYAPHSTAGRALLFHELAHVVQQDGRSASGPLSIGPVDHAGERQASAAADAAARGVRVGRLAPTPAGLVMRSPLSEKLAKLAVEPKAKVFDLLRQHGAAKDDVDTRVVLETRFAWAPDDLWLANQLVTYGPEPLWPGNVLSERARLAQQDKWAAEPGNIEADLPFPAGTDTTGIPPVKAYFFPGSTGDRALVIGGVHGSEVQGARTVELLRAELAKASAAGRPPKFTTILVPVLNARTHDPALKKQGQRYLPRRPQEVAADAATRKRETGGIEPNRTFPAPDESYADVAKREAEGKPGLVFKGKPRDREHATTVMPPETRALVTLIERFSPSRIASVHAHSMKGGKKGDDAGIFVDPAVRKDKTLDPAGDTLAGGMLAAGKKRLPNLPKEAQAGKGSPFSGNVDDTTRYANSVATQEGYSLGDWAPGRGINTITIEIPQYGSDAKYTKAIPAVEQMHMEVLMEVFLGVPKAP
jgi:hypothetical protein